MFDARGVLALADDMPEGHEPVDCTLWRIAGFGLWDKVFGAIV